MCQYKRCLIRDLDLLGVCCGIHVMVKQYQGHGGISGSPVSKLTQAARLDSLCCRKAFAGLASFGGQHMRLVWSAQRCLFALGAVGMAHPGRSLHGAAPGPVLATQAAFKAKLAQSGAAPCNNFAFLCNVLAVPSVTVLLCIVPVQQQCFCCCVLIGICPVPV